MKILSTAGIREVEARAIASGAATAAGLMEVAVAGCLEFFVSRHDLPRRALVLAGKGHNGNDALLLASLLRAGGWEVETVLSEAPAKRTGIDLEAVRGEERLARVWPDRPEPRGRWTVVDGLLGSGVSGAPRGAAAEMLRWSAGLGGDMRRIALDFPSGLDPDTGVVHEPCFMADWTLAIGSVKPGCLVDAARNHTGRLAGIPLPLDLPDSAENFVLPRDAASWVKPLPSNIHKYRKGEVAVWAGSPGMAGAAVLASRAALRAGAGVVRLFTHPDVEAALSLATPEIMVQAVRPDGPLPGKLVEAGTILAGPGVGRGAGAATLLRRFAEETRASLLIDADALHLLAAQPELVGLFSARPCVLTPHSGELAVLTGGLVGERKAAVENWHRKHPRTTLVAKGPNTLVVDPLGRISWNGTGHPGMATAGMGDVLSGVIAALLARGYAPETAARLGVCWHGRAAELAVQNGGESNLIAGDVTVSLPAAWREMECLDRI